MRLEELLGHRPEDVRMLTEELGVERAIEAIESADTRALTTAGLSRGRATRILRRATGAESMDLLATRDARDVYKELLDLAEEYAVTADAADSIRVLTPLPTREAMAERLDDVLEARDTWATSPSRTSGPFSTRSRSTTPAGVNWPRSTWRSPSGTPALKAACSNR